MKKNNNKKENDFIDIIDETLQRISNENKVIDSLSKILEKNTALSAAESQKTVQDISDSIDLIADNFEDLQIAKNSGKTRMEWLKNKLDETITKYSPENPSDLITEIKGSLKDSNIKIGIDVFGKEIEISEILISSKYENLNKTAIVKDFQEEIKNNTLLGAIVFEKNSITIDEKHKEIQAVKDYFNAKLDSPSDNNFKKAISTATVIAQKNNLLPVQLKDKTPDEIAMIVDKGVTAAKVAYKLGKGELSPIDAVEYTIDRNVAILNSAITKTTTKYGGIVGGKVGAFIGSVFGPVGTVIGAAIGTVVGKVAGYIVGTVICEGIKKVASAVKSVCSTAWEGIKSVASALNPFNWF